MCLKKAPIERKVFLGGGDKEVMRRVTSVIKRCKHFQDSNEKQMLLITDGLGCWQLLTSPPPSCLFCWSIGYSFTPALLI